MSKHHFAKGVGCAVLTAVAAVGTVVLTVITVSLAMTVVGIPLAIVTGAAAVGCAVGMIYCADRTAHHLDHAFNDDYHHHHHFDEDSSMIISESLAMPGDTNKIRTKKVHFAGVDQKQEKDVFYKPLFARTPSESVNQTPINEQHFSPS